MSFCAGNRPSYLATLSHSVCSTWSGAAQYRESDKRADGSYAFEWLSRYFDVHWSFCAASLQPRDSKQKIRKRFESSWIRIRTRLRWLAENNAGGSSALLRLWLKYTQKKTLSVHALLKTRAGAARGERTGSSKVCLEMEHVTTSYYSLILV